ncbi:MAG: amino acid permease [bacterium]|nr:amino acid permease [bacterium]
MVSEEPKLKRTLSVWLLTLYGLGTTVGAGIYALTGEVAGGAGMAAPLAFLLASLIAGVSALSFAELSSLYPQSAGEALYVRKGFGLRWLATLVGLMVALAGTVSAAAVANGFVGYLAELVEIPRALSITLFVIGLGAISAWGIGVSVRLAGIITVIEVGGVVAIIAAASASLTDLPQRWSEFLPPLELGAWNGILGATILAFYAFIGFEDMVNVAEEVRDVRRSMPIAIISTLVLTSVFYVGLATVAVLAVPPEELAESAAPLAMLWQRTTGLEPTLIGFIGVVAMLNGALIQLVMAPRVLYGLARQGSLPKVLGQVHPSTRTPVLATVVATIVTWILALFLPLAPLAAITSVLTLAIFALVNLALWRLKARPSSVSGVLDIPRWVPAIGFIVSLIFVGIALF